MNFCTGGFYALLTFVITIDTFVVIWGGIWIKKSKMTNRTQKYGILIMDVNNQ